MTKKPIIYVPSPKAIDVFKRRKEAKIRFLEGAVRSAKSFTANDLTIFELQELPAGNVLVSGYSITSVARNVIAEWKKIIDPHDLGLFRNHKNGKDDYMTINWRGLRDKKFYIRGASKQNDFEQIQGATFLYWYADELTRHSESFVDMAISRLSMAESAGVWTANPDTPYHFVKKRFIDDPVLTNPFKDGERAFLKRWTFYLEDNPSLPEDYVNSLKSSFTGFFHKRYILAQWVSAEGAVYDFFDENKHTIKLEDCPRPIYKAISIDYGTTNPVSVGVYGVNPTSKDLKVWRIKGFYFDSKEAGFQLSDTEICERIANFLRDDDITYIIVDPSAASFKVELSRFIANGRLKGIVRDAENSVVDGIRNQAKMLKNGEYKIVQDHTNQQCIEDYGAYMWDIKAQERGLDKPIKDNDHTKDEERYLLATLFGIDSLTYEVWE